MAFPNHCIFFSNPDWGRMEVVFTDDILFTNQPTPEPMVIEERTDDEKILLDSPSRTASRTSTLDLQLMSDDTLDELFIDADSNPELTHNSMNEVNWRNVVSVSQYIRDLQLPGGVDRQPSPNNRLHQRRIRPQPHTSVLPCCLTAPTPTTKLRLPIGHGKSAVPGSFTNLCYLTQRQSGSSSPIHQAVGTKTRCARRTSTLGAIGHPCPGSAFRPDGKSKPIVAISIGLPSPCTGAARTAATPLYDTMIWWDEFCPELEDTTVFPTSPVPSEREEQAYGVVNEADNRPATPEAGNNDLFTVNEDAELHVPFHGWDQFDSAQPPAVQSLPLGK
ncbi:hypothetical protein DAPPUDRAFT_102735 [Daphnia pulex]|uniref:Uncharacterized protein n=1 Tax=Daphnia pulex TaxID=6669 RepID=E9GHC5_DAPPU|nr:hypothetical protein DAPPUDRAFT_102735 [Daphnia pulex]|eukprot:EFX81203.1 hypothetical protein DAPPUDRAFT_102735 [Daphnia pulex]